MSSLKAELTERLEEALKSESETEGSGSTETTSPPTESPKKRKGRRASIDSSAETIKLPKLNEESAETTSEALIEETTKNNEIAAEAEPVKVQPVNAESVETIESVELDSTTLIADNLISDNFIADTTTLDTITTPPGITTTAPSSSSASTEFFNVPAATQTECIVHVSHLTRPFTLNEFKGILEVYGQVKDVWLDSLKSQSFVTFVHY